MGNCIVAHVLKAVELDVLNLLLVLREGEPNDKVLAHAAFQDDIARDVVSVHALGSMALI